MPRNWLPSLLASLHLFDAFAMEMDLPPPSHRENLLDPEFPPFAGSMKGCDEDAKHRYGFVAVSLAGCIDPAG